MACLSRYSRLGSASRAVGEGLQLSIIDAIELNEAFASQALAVLRHFGVDDTDDRVNANDGAIALGHPLGMSGARLAMTVVHRLHQTGGRLGLVTLCVGVGQGVALAVEQASWVSPITLPR